MALIIDGKKIAAELRAECIARTNRLLEKGIKPRLDVIIVDDIIDTGYTMQFVIDHVKKLGAKSVKTCVLLDKPSRRKVDLKPDYCCFEIDDLFVVGYGLDYEGFYRNVPYVFNWENK